MYNFGYIVVHHDGQSWIYDTLEEAATSENWTGQLRAITQLTNEDNVRANEIHIASA